MKNILYIIFIFSLSLDAQNPNLRGSIYKTASLEMTVKVKPTALAINPSNTSTGAVLNVGISIPKVPANEAVPPVMTLTSLIGGIYAADVVDGTSTPGFWIYQGVLNQAGFPALGLDIEADLYRVSFPSSAAGRSVRLVNNENTNNGFFDYVIPGYPGGAIDPLVKFYAGGIVDNSIPSNSYVESAAPLPITLLTFNVTKLNSKSVKLNWKTSLEINSDFFGIERSKDGNTWETIGKVIAAGNSSKELAYEFIDDNLPLIRTKEQVFYYRLRMTDLDGKYQYSDVRGVNFGKLSTGVVTIYPNPTVEHINVDLSGMDLDAGKVDLFVYDMSGRQVIKKNIIGNGIELIDVSQLPANTYNVVVKQGETAYQQRVIKID